MPNWLSGESGFGTADGACLPRVADIARHLVSDSIKAADRARPACRCAVRRDLNSTAFDPECMPPLPPPKLGAAREPAHAGKPYAAKKAAHTCVAYMVSEAP